nr:hypothetical protein JVH1_4231 [Rhodococcus sp. JVH1]
MKMFATLSAAHSIRPIAVISTQVDAEMVQNSQIRTVLI